MMATADIPITKRIIISGLTPAITVEDISHRLASFGTVQNTEGFGLLDGVGQPRKFGYVTLETTTGKLAKCMNLLSGTTWKGAKLRLGEAKPDYAERIAIENKKAAEEPPKERHRHYGAVYADDMSPITPENVAERPGWKVSALGRITNPLKMRPTHPLVDMEETKTKKGKKPSEPEKKKKKRAKDPDTRARRTTIDMPTYGSTHLKGMFLDLELPETSRRRIVGQDPVIDNQPDSENESDSDNEGSFQAIASKQAPRNYSPPLASSSSQKPSPPSVPAMSTSESPSPSKKAAISLLPVAGATTSNALLEGDTDIEIEKAQTLTLLASLFGNNPDGDWVGRESVGSDIDVDELVKGDVMLVDDDEVGFEVMPKAGGKSSAGRPTRDESEEYSEDDDEEEASISEAQKPVDAPQNEVIAIPLPPKSTTTKLKDLFAPREEEAGFSLLGHLDLDMELEDEIPFLTEQQPTQGYQQEPTSFTSTHIATATVTLQTHSSRAPLVLNPKQALFFPLPVQEGGNATKARQRDVYDLAKDNGWYWRDPAVGFFRTETEDEIKARWEGCKGELTREWKRRWREAGKVSRRKKRGVDEDE